MKVWLYMFHLKSLLYFQMSILIPYFKLGGIFPKVYSPGPLWQDGLSHLPWAYTTLHIIQLTIPIARPSSLCHPLCTQKRHLLRSKMHHEPTSDNHVTSSWAPVTRFQLHTWHFNNNGPLLTQSHLKLNLTLSILTKELPYLTSVSVNGFNILPITQTLSLYLF